MKQQSDAQGPHRPKVHAPKVLASALKGHSPGTAAQVSSANGFAIT